MTLDLQAEAAAYLDQARSVLAGPELDRAGVPNLTRLETFGDTASQWLSVTVKPKSPEVFTWEQRTIPAA
jgi:hypothetical protein